MLKRATKLTLVILLLLAWSTPSQAASVTVAWDPNPEPDVVAYLVHWGTAPGRYEWSARVTGTEWSAEGLEDGVTYYFTVQAVNIDGLVSLYSEVAVAALPTRPSIRSFTSPVSLPGTVGLPMSWKAEASGGLAPLEYRFFLYSQKTGEWTTIADYGGANEVTWTPTESGVYALQAWVRNAGSTATYQDWKSTGYFAVGGEPQVTMLRREPSGPVRVGYPFTLTADVSGGIAPLQYQFWVLDMGTGRWSVLGDYGPSNQAVFTPRRVGNYAVQVWVRSAGSVARYDAWAGSGGIQATTQVVLQSFTSNVEAPVAAGTPVTWTALAGGAANIEYKFWLLRIGGAGWTVLRDWGPESEVEWTPEEPGSYYLQAWVREAGSNADFADWKGTNAFVVTPADHSVVVHSLSLDRVLPVAGTTVNISARATGGIGGLLYQFWLYDGQTRDWSVLQDYSSSPNASWTPSAAGTYAIQVWVRSADSTAKYDAWKGSGFLEVAGVKVTVSSLVSDVTFPAPAGVPVVWRASASASNGAALEYQFWLHDAAAGTWTVLQPWGPADLATWTPVSPGTYHLQVWVRTQDSPANYEGWLGTKDLVVR